MNRDRKTPVVHFSKFDVEICEFYCTLVWLQTTLSVLSVVSLYVAYTAVVLTITSWGAKPLSPSSPNPNANHTDLNRNSTNPNPNAGELTDNYRLTKTDT